jgi:solute:Na+ symporter, SSS family
MIARGSATLSLFLGGIKMPFGLDANIYGIVLAAFTYSIFHFIEKNKLVVPQPAS